MSACGPKPTWASALQMSSFGGQSGHDFLRRECLLLTQGGIVRVLGVIANPPCRICRRYWFRVPAPAARTHLRELAFVRLR
jgi:hypothetical protein